MLGALGWVWQHHGWLFPCLGCQNRKQEKIKRWVGTLQYQYIASPFHQVIQKSTAGIHVKKEVGEEVCRGYSMMGDVVSLFGVTN